MYLETIALDKTLFVHKQSNGILNEKTVVNKKEMERTVSWLRRLVTGLSQQSPGFVPGTFLVGFVVDSVALGQVFSEFFGLPCQYYSTVVIHTHTLSGDEQYVRQWQQFRDAVSHHQKSNKETERTWSQYIFGRHSRALKESV
jgi:hypothetical protein